MQDLDLIHGEQLGPRVVKVLPLRDYLLKIAFDNDEERVFDMAPLLALPAFQPLADDALFRAVRVEHGSVAWPNDIDLCPDTLYAQSR